MIKDIIKELRDIEQASIKKKIEFEKKLFIELKKFRGKCLKNKSEFPVKISITFIPINQNWDNDLDTIHSFYCEDDKSSWYRIDEKQSKNNLWDLEELFNAEEISPQEYYNLRKEIVLKAKQKELEQLNKLFEQQASQEQEKEKV